MEKLLHLDHEHFEYRQWLALKYAQEWTFLGGEDPAGSYMEDFRSQYSHEERRFVLKLMRMMLFANYAGNLYFRRPWKKSIPVSCDLNGKGQERVI